MKFSVEELLRSGSHKWKKEEVDLVTLRNLEDLCRKINQLGYNPPAFATSCLRSIKDQQRINPRAMGSSHLYGCAVDIADSDGKIAEWCMRNKAKLVECGLWMESPKYTEGWLHLQSYAPKSFTRMFVP